MRKIITLAVTVALTGCAHCGAPAGDGSPDIGLASLPDGGLGPIQTGRFKLGGPEEVNLGLEAYSYYIGNPGRPGTDAGTYNDTVLCTDLTTGADGCTNTSTHTCSYCLQRNSMYDSPNFEFNDTNDSNVVFCKQNTCGTSPWTALGVDTSTSNAYVFFGDNPTTGGMRSYHQWWGNFFPTPVTTYQFWVNIENNYAGGVYCTNGSGTAIEGIYTPFDHKLCLTQSPANNFNGATNMFSMSRESAGHFVHDTYGFYGTTALDEGWADVSYLRVLVYWWQLGLNDWSGLSYSTTLWANGTGFVAQHGDKLVNGEHVASEVVSGTSGSFYFPAAGCDTNQDYSGNPWQCAAVMSEVYWELVFNTCRLSYNGCSGQIVGTSGPYGSSTPWVFANATYAHALADTWTYGTSSEPVEAFMKDVETWYENYEAQGYFSSTEIANVQTVLAHHCVGNEQHCSDGSFKLPGSPLPDQYTAKGPLFFEAENGTLSGHATGVTANNTASNNKYEALQYSSMSPGTTTFSSVSLAAGTYKVAISAHQSSSSGTAHWSYKWDSGSWNDGGAVSYDGGAWQWLNGSTGLTVSSQSNHTIAVKVSSSGTIDVDVVVLNKQ
jgi:hypothetical protein